MQNTILEPTPKLTAPGPIQRDIAGIFSGLQRRYEAARAALGGIPQTRTCPEHPGQMQPLDAEKTIGCRQPTYGDCPVCEAARKQRALVRAWVRRGVPLRLAEADLKNYDPRVSESAAAALATVRAYVAAATERENAWTAYSVRGGFLLLSGPQGTGKSHLAVGALKAIRPKVGTICADVEYTTHADVLFGLRATYGAKKDTAADYIERMRECPALVIDEFGLSGGGADEAPAIQAILAARYDASRPTIIVSNETLPALHRALGFRLSDRIAENCHVAVVLGESYRRRSA